MVSLSYFTTVIDVVVIGGGLAGLINAIQLKRKGLSVTLFEEKKYPFHRVCGEYISNEVIPFLKKNELFPEDLHPTDITQFQLTAPSGQGLKMKLDLGGFGVSRYRYDEWLASKALNEGVEIIHQRVISCNYESNQFQLTTNNDSSIACRIAIGAFGKRSLLDKKLDRNFISKRSPYIGVKYHIKTSEASDNEIALHNFQNGYCGISKIEDDTYNLCYLSHRNNLKNYSDINEMEKQVLLKNPHLKQIFDNSEFLFKKPEVINEISFMKKEPVYNHILMTGDSAGMITPLCGNGMAMAIHSAKILSELILKHFTQDQFDRLKLEREYSVAWQKQFSQRLWAGRKIQSLFGASKISEWTVSAGKYFPSLSSFLMKQTHGKPF
ncbi:MAG: NAD(P)/FAD-dependent oxidoreductase [Ekhidna sp.]